MDGLTPPRSAKGPTRPPPRVLADSRVMADPRVMAGEGRPPTTCLRALSSHRVLIRRDLLASDPMPSTTAICRVMARIVAAKPWRSAASNLFYRVSPPDAPPDPASGRSKVLV